MTTGDQPNDIFDVQRIRQIIELMEQHDLSEVDLQQGEEKIRLSRGAAAPIVAAAPVVSAASPAAGSSAIGSSAAAGGGGSDATAGTVTIDAPMVGTFYAKPNPESEMFVKVGDQIGPDTVVCIVEAMKVFNEIPAEISGEVVEVLLSDGTPVDFGKPMIRVRPA